MEVRNQTKYSAAPKRVAIAAAIAVLCVGFTAPALADSNEDMLNVLHAKGILSDAEYEMLLSKSRSENKANAMQQAAVADTAEKAAKATHSSGVTWKVGGFVESAGIYRNANEAADIASNWSAIPYAGSNNGNTSEYRQSERQSRLSVLASGKPNDYTTLAAYTELDFLGAAQTANSKESNSYTPRVRHFYATYEREDMGFHFLAGQAWSLLTPNKVGITPRTEVTPLTIDAQYVPGFNWSRNTQFRIVKDFDKTFWLGLSLESPQALVAGTVPTIAGSTITATTAAGSGFNSANTYSTDKIPDVIVKGAIDPGWGHYELYGLYREFSDRVSLTTIPSSGSDNTTTGAGFGGFVLLPIVPKMFDLQASFLKGHGVGRYGSAQLPDVTYNLDGSFAAIPETDYLFGAIFHPAPEWDIYGYYGREQATQQYSNNGVTKAGYGDPTINVTSCYAGATGAGACGAQVANVSQWTLGAWWKFFQGSYGTMQWGASYSHTVQSTFAGVLTGGGSGAPDPDMNVYMVSFRYYPYQ